MKQFNLKSQEVYQKNSALEGTIAAVEKCLLKNTDKVLTAREKHFRVTSTANITDQ